jgi:glutathione reductase (NADPH)
MEKYDVVILGGGNGGMGVTVAPRAAGLSVAMTEARDLGGMPQSRLHAKEGARCGDPRAR